MLIESVFWQNFQKESASPLIGNIAAVLVIPIVLAVGR